MESNNHYCPVVGKCPHKNVKIIPNSFFLIEPFDENKDKREKAIDEGLRNYYGNEQFTLKIGDKEITEIGLFCDICKKIKSCQVCIADITPRILFENISNKSTKILAIKENVMLELGLAYGFQTPVIIISRKIEDKRYIPSDLGFIRYLANTTNVPYDSWNNLSDSLLDHLSGIGSVGYYKRKLPDEQKELIRRMLKEIRIVYNSKKCKSKIDGKKLKITEFRLDGKGQLIAIITNADLLMEGMLLKLIKIENKIETPVGILQVFHLQSNHIAQAYCTYDDEDDEKELSNQVMKSHNILSAYDNKLEVYIKEEYQEISIERLELSLKMMKYLV